MESYCRNLLKRNYNLTIISGPLFLPVEVNGIKMMQHQVCIQYKLKKKFLKFEILNFVLR